MLHWSYELMLAGVGQAAAVAEREVTATARIWDWPSTPGGWLLLLLGVPAIVAWVIWLYRRDTSEVHPGWKYWLLTLRLGALGGLLIIALNPQDRTHKQSFRPSRVALLIDTSLSMRHPSESPRGETLAGDRPAQDLTGPQIPRSEAVQRWLTQTPLLDRLRERHEVSVFTFDSTLNGPRLTLSMHRPPGTGTATGNKPAVGIAEATEPPIPWAEVLAPRGLETRLGEAVSELIRQLGTRTLSGVVLVSDGAANAGIDPQSAHDRAVAAKARMITVGVGGTEPPINLQITDVQAPTDVQAGDLYELSAFLTGQSLAGRQVEVELLVQPEQGPGEAQLVAQQSATLLEDGVPVEVKFTQRPTIAGRFRYVVRARPTSRVVEFNEEDNQTTVAVNVSDKPTRVLLVAGGPMRDYQFVRNLLFRHKSVDVDVLLQTAGAGTSQESNAMLAAFPATREQLYEYDVVIAFDPDWNALPAEGLQALNTWVFQEAGGVIFVAGDVFTQQLSLNPGVDPTSDPLQPVKELLPVLLGSYFAAARFDQDSSQPWPVQLTSEGKGAEFLQLTDDPLTSLKRWSEFPGFFRCYPTQGPKAGATVYARFADPRAAADYPILLAGQFFGQGRTMYLGSGELWRLRSTGDEEYDRFWIKALREVGQGRLKRGAKRGLLMPESRRVLLGQTVRVRSRLLDGQYQPVSATEIPLVIYDPSGKPLSPPRKMVKDPARAGEFTGDFRVSLPGVYQLEVAIPDSRDHLHEEITVTLPKLEDENTRQNVKVLSDLARDTGGAYLTLAEAAEKIPELLPDRGEQFDIPERLRTLWDRDWVLYLLVGLLSLEWLTRKLLKLA